MAFFMDSALLGLQYALLAVGVYITFRILNIPDLTADGSFTLGMAVSAQLSVTGHPWLGLALALCAGALAGTVTGLLQTKMGIHAILAGILTMSGLYTVNIGILGGPNVSLLSSVRFYEVFTGLGLSKDAAKAVGSLLICAVAIGGLTLFFRSVLGLSIRAAGDNEDMVKASSINTTAVRMIALALANGMAALSGGILAQCQGFGDINSGSGMIVIGLASVIIGEVIFGKRGVLMGLLAALTGSVLYRLLIALALWSNVLSANALKLVSAVIVAITLSIPAIRGKIEEKRLQNAGHR